MREEKTEDSPLMSERLGMGSRLKTCAKASLNYPREAVISDSLF